jgi:hypothetical protein
MSDQLSIAAVDETFRSARLVRAISRYVADQFAFPGTTDLELDPADVEPEITGKPVRRVMSRSAVTNKGYFLSDRSGEILPWESRIELFALQRLDCMDGVTQIFTQPVTVEYSCPFKQRRRLATPDIFIVFDGRPMLIEVKEDLSTLKADERQQLALLEQLFSRAGVQYRTWVQDEICVEPLLSNALWLARYKSVALSESDRLAILGLFSESSDLTLEQVGEQLGDRSLMRPYAMVLRNWLMTAPDCDIRQNPTVRINPRLSEENR